MKILAYSDILIVFISLCLIISVYTYNIHLESSNYRKTFSTIFNAKANTPTEGSFSPCRIKVIGVGGGGGNAVNRMVESTIGVSGVELWAMNTDAQALSRSLAPNIIKIGQKTSR